MNITELESRTRDELLEQAKSIGVNGASGLKKRDLILRLLQVQSETEGNLLSGGVIDIVDDGYGFLRGEVTPSHQHGCVRLAIASAALRTPPR